jgi:hypothetical protein
MRATTSLFAAGLAFSLVIPGNAASQSQLLAGVGADAAVLQVPPAVAAVGPTEEAIRFREDVGLQSDLSYVRDVAASDEATTTDYGFPLLNAEVEYLHRREAAREQVGDLREYLDKYPTSFAGLYLDNTTAYKSGVALTFVVSFTADAESHRSAIESFLPTDSTLALKTAANSYQELKSIVSAIDADRAWHRSLGIEVYFAGVDEVRNKVLLGISEPSENAARALANAYGRERVYVFPSAPPQPDSCIRTACPPPWPAGLNINNNANPALGNHCTSGYSMKSSSGNWFMTTAGHCPDDHWWHNGMFMGATPAGKNRFVSGSYADVQAYDVAQANHSNVVLTGAKNCNPCLFRTITARQPIASDVVGDTTCISGAYTNSNCGVLKIRFGQYFYAAYGVTLEGQRTADYIRNPGDSGAPVFRGTLALGSHVNFQPDSGWGVYSHIDWAETELGMAMCFTGC